MLPAKSGYSNLSCWDDNKQETTLAQKVSCRHLQVELNGLTSQIPDRQKWSVKIGNSTNSGLPEVASRTKNNERKNMACTDTLSPEDKSAEARLCRVRECIEH